MFSLQTPLGGFLQALTQPLAPSHLLATSRSTELADDPFGRQPIGSGPFALVELTDTSASLVAAADFATVEAEGSSNPSSSPATDSLTSPAPTRRPSRPQPYLSGIEFRFYGDAETAGERLPGWHARCRVGAVPGSWPADLGGAPGARLLRYPGATLTAVLLNLRPSHPEFATPAVRTALLQGIDRGRLIEEAYAMSAATATGPIPPSSPMFDAAADAARHVRPEGGATRP